MNQALLSPPGGAQKPSDGLSPVRHLYAHIPFCPTKCDYCAFVTHIGSNALIAPYVSALRREATRWVDHACGGPLETVYLGGGTPSMLSPQQISDLLGTFEDCFGISTAAEVSMEAHPSTVDAAKLDGYRKAGINRISFGVESLVPRELQALGRLGDEHTPITAVRSARRAGFDSIAADLMYGIPRQTTRSWTDTLHRLVALGPDHLSLYPLQIEPKTVFELRRQRHELAVPEDDQVVEMYHLACAVLSSAGYLHYEVGSWCRNGHESRHNLSYWHNREYFGLGVGAHGYVNSRRTVNVRQTSRYIELVEAGLEPTLEAEEIDRETSRAETIMLGLRLLSDGLDLDEIRADHDWDLRAQRGSELDLLARAGLIRLDGNRIFLTESAVPVANEVWERLAL